MIFVPHLNLAFNRLSIVFRNRSAWHGRTWHSRIGDRLSQLRRALLPTDAELDRQSLEDACDLYDLEQRIRELDRSRWPARGPLHPFKDR
jgi:hypothetical protein